MTFSEQIDNISVSGLMKRLTKMIEAPVIDLRGQFPATFASTQSGTQSGILVNTGRNVPSRTRGSFLGNAYRYIVFKDI